jgi:hypothetical protein
MPKQKLRRVLTRAPPPDPDAGQTIPEFCGELRIATSTFQNWRALDRKDGLEPGQGRAPRIFQPNGPGGLVRILPQDKAEWRARRSGKGQLQSTA